MNAARQLATRLIRGSDDSEASEETNKRTTSPTEHADCQIVKFQVDSAHLLLRVMIQQLSQIGDLGIEPGIFLFNSARIILPELLIWISNHSY